MTAIAWPPPPWTEAALCAQVDPDMFFPDEGGATRAPKRICQSCEVRVQCLDYALEHGEHHGVWGGLSALERRALRRRAA